VVPTPAAKIFGEQNFKPPGVGDGSTVRFTLRGATRRRLAGIGEFPGIAVRLTEEGIKRTRWPQEHSNHGRSTPGMGSSQAIATRVPSIHRFGASRQTLTLRLGRGPARPIVEFEG
jgi:hypothetical protein